jgi:hypothetical protein
MENEKMNFTVTKLKKGWTLMIGATTDLLFFTSAKQVTDYIREVCDPDDNEKKTRTKKASVKDISGSTMTAN